MSCTDSDTHLTLRRKSRYYKKIKSEITYFVEWLIKKDKNYASMRDSPSWTILRNIHDLSWASMIYNNNNKEFYHRDYVFLGEKMNCSMLCRLLCFSELADRALECRSQIFPQFFFFFNRGKTNCHSKTTFKIRLLGCVLVRSVVPLYPIRGPAETKLAPTSPPPAPPPKKKKTIATISHGPYVP
jgi:hypothetical protein